MPLQAAFQGEPKLMVTATSSSPHLSRVNRWDYAAIGLLALTGFALSYDALRQTAQAIHVRGALTYVYPLIIDGFIAYSVRALLILRTAPLAARAYVWALFLSSTTASVWANILHAVRLNQQALDTIDRLHLGDTAVGILSMIAPLALAGAVHLGIITSRHNTPDMTTVTGTDVDLHEMPASDSGQHHRPTEAGSTASSRRSLTEADADDQLAERPEGPGALTADREEPADHSPPGRGSGEAGEGRPVGRPPAATMNALLTIGRQAWTQAGRLSRSVVADAIRARSLSVSSDRLTAVMDALRAEQDTAHQADGQLALS